MLHNLSRPIPLSVQTFPAQLPAGHMKGGNKTSAREEVIAEFIRSTSSLLRSCASCLSEILCECACVCVCNVLLVEMMIKISLNCCFLPEWSMCVCVWATTSTQFTNDSGKWAILLVVEMWFPLRTGFDKRDLFRPKSHHDCTVYCLLL